MLITSMDLYTYIYNSHVNAIWNIDDICMFQIVVIIEITDNDVINITVRLKHYTLY